MNQLTTKATETKTQAGTGDRRSQGRQKWVPTEREIEGLFVSEFRDNDPRCAILVRQIIETHRAKNNTERKKIVDAIQAGNEWQRIAATWEKFCRRALARSAFSHVNDDSRTHRREAMPEPVNTIPTSDPQPHPAADAPICNTAADVEEVALADIDLDCAIRVREKFNQEVVDKYTELLKEGVMLPPIRAFRVNGVLRLTDGEHRTRAAKKAGRETIQAIIIEGNEQDALKDALGANAQHGLPRSNKDKRRVAILGIQNFGHLSDREIASICQVSNTFIGEVRAELSTADSSSPRTGKDGKTRRHPTRKPKTNESGEKSGDARPSQPSSGREDRDGTGEEPAGTATETPPSENTSDTGDNNGPASAAEESKVSRVDAVWQWLVPALEIRIKSLTAAEREELAVRLAVLADGLCSKEQSN